MSPGLEASSKNEVSLFDDDDGWQDMPVVRNDDFANGLDEEDQKKYHYVAPQKLVDGPQGNATGNLIDFDDRGNEWRSKLEVDEGEYTRLRLEEDDETEDVHLRTKYLFDEDKAMTPLSQMQATKGLLTEAQRIAYVGLCALSIREMATRLRDVKSKEMKAAVASIELWALKIMGRLYYHMELATPEQKMIESLADHGVQAMDLVPSLMTTHTVANPEYDPVEAKKQEEERLEEQRREERREEQLREDRGKEKSPGEEMPEVEQLRVDEAKRVEKYVETVLVRDTVDIVVQTASVQSSGLSTTFPAPPMTPVTVQQRTTANVMQPIASTSIPGVSTTLSSTDASITLDIRWTILCDLFLLLIADSVYDSRSRVLLESVASKLGLGWLDVVKFEKRVTDALEIQENIEKMEQKEVIEGRMKAAKKKRYVMIGLATLGGGLVMGLSAGLLAPVIGAGLGAAFTTFGVTGTTGFFAGAGGAALITTGGTLTGSGIAVKGMVRRTKQVRTFELLPLHNNKRVNCIITVPGFMQSVRDDVRLPFSVLDPLVGDVFSVLWEPEMMEETGNAIKLLTGEILSQLSTTVLQATIMTSLMSALTWPIILTKLGYLIDNPWSNALDRARAAGSVLADILIRRHIGVRPIMLIGFSLGARVIFYALLELAKAKAYGVVQDAFLLGATLTAPTRAWLEARSVVAGRLVNGYARNDWVLNYLFRATSGGIYPVAGLRPIQNVPGLENVDVSDKIAGHGSYRTFMPLILDQLGFPVSADYFDEPEEPDMVGDREVIRQGEEGQKKKRSWFSRDKRTTQDTANVQRPPSSLSFPRKPSTKSPSTSKSDELPERVAHSPPQSGTPRGLTSDSTSSLPVYAGFDFTAIHEMLQKEAGKVLDGPKDVQAPSADTPVPLSIVPPPSYKESVPLQTDSTTTPRGATPVLHSSSSLSDNESPKSSSMNSSAQSVPIGQSLPRSPAFDHLHEPIPSPHLQPSTVASSFLNAGSPPMSSLPSSRPPPAPTLSLKGYDSAVWASGSEPNPTSIFDSRDSSGVFTEKSPFAASKETLSFGNMSASIASSTFSSPNLSFGGPDGSISFAAHADPWGPPQFGATSKKSGPNANPWENTG